MEGLFLLYVYAVVMLFLTLRDCAEGTRQFNTGGGRLRPGIGSLSIAAAWIWAPALFVSAERSYLYGWQGLAWFVVPNVLSLVFFSPFAARIRHLFPEGSTLSGFMQDRYKSRPIDFGRVYTDIVIRVRLAMSFTNVCPRYPKFSPRVTTVVVSTALALTLTFGLLQRVVVMPTTETLIRVLR